MTRQFGIDGWFSESGTGAWRHRIELSPTEAEHLCTLNTSSYSYNP
jgi:hypothetical protein